MRYPHLTSQFHTMRICTCIAAASFFICSLTQAFSQPKQCYSYDYLKSEKKIWTYLFKGDNLEYLSDDIAGREIFNSKQELRSKGTIIPIPVLRFDYNRVAQQDETIQLNSLFTPDYSVFTAFLMNREELQNLILSNSGYQYPDFRRIENVTPTDSSTAVSIYKIFNDGKACFFYDDSRGRYAYFRDNDYIYYNQKSKGFSTLSAKEYIADYKSYYSIK